MTSIAPNPNAVTWLSVDERGAGQRIDNFLARHLKGVPRSHIYRILRSGEVRVDGRRVDAAQRLHAGAVLRIPPVRVALPADRLSGTAVRPHLSNAILYEDDALLAIDKPAGMAVHGGSGISRGVIEQLRLERPQAKFLELVHRLDRETSGVLLIGKKRSALTRLHDMMRENRVHKRYLMLVKGAWQDKKRRVVLPLMKYDLANGEKRVCVEAGGQHSETVFYLRERLGDYTLLEAELVTGRTHQLRVQLAHLGFPILGDAKYGDYTLNKRLQKRGLKRMFLHSAETTLAHPLTGASLRLQAPLPEDLARFLKSLRDGHAETV
ncbi:MAG: RluA family pseudouridine synthase [Methylophilaceae bacterium]|nr:RluA family pseudouridine synthase [Methylophilaceae bacterium]